MGVQFGKSAIGAGQDYVEKTVRVFLSEILEEGADVKLTSRIDWVGIGLVRTSSAGIVAQAFICSL